MTSLVALEDLGDALLRTQRLAGWARGEVGVGERIGDGRLLSGELGGQELRKASRLCLGPRTGVVRDESAEPIRGAECAEVTGASSGWKPVSRSSAQ